jgi:hypothetical protein
MRHNHLMIKTNQNKYAVKSNGQLVAGFSRKFNGIVQLVGEGGSPKAFSTYEKAKEFVSKYADLGYGFGIEGTEIVSL